MLPHSLGISLDYFLKNANNNVRMMLIMMQLVMGK